MRKGDLKKNLGVADVAAEAGVSPATVSRAFNFPDIVKESVRNHIFEVAARLKYSPHPAAKALRSRKTHIVGVAIPTLDYAIFATMIDEFQNKFSEHGYTTIVLTTGFDNRSVYEKVNLLINRGSEAILLVGAVEDLKLRSYIESSNIPFVTTYSIPPDDLVPSIGFDNYAATAEATNHLIRLGHKNLVMIAGPKDGNDRQRSRITAFRDCLAANGLQSEGRVESRNYVMLDGPAAFGALLDRYPTTTGLICADIFAVGAMAECRRRGLRVPEDISIVGHDDTEIAALLDPPLTTIAVPASEMGGVAAESLRRALTTRERPASAVLNTKLVVRGTTAEPSLRIRN